MTIATPIEVQRRLVALGHDLGPSGADGKIGPLTLAAIWPYLPEPKSEPAPAGFQIDPRALALVKEFEGFEGRAYKDAVGVLTIGYGTTARAGLGIDPQIGMTITEPEASDLLRRGLEKFDKQIAGGFTRQPTPAQRGAMLSLAYNIGPGAFLGSTVLRRFNAGDIPGAADAFRMWNKAGGKELRGLTRRREAERALFLSA